MAKGGVGLLIVESCGVEYPLGIHHFPVQFHLDDDKYIPSYTELVQVVHKHGCPVFLCSFSTPAPWNPTGLLPKRDTNRHPTLTEAELPGTGIRHNLAGVSLAEIEDLIQMFVKAAQRAQKAGFDGVENKCSNLPFDKFILFTHFLTNREDEFGCSAGNRARFLNRIIIDTKKQLGPDFAVTALLISQEYGHEKATTFEGVFNLPG